MCASAVEWRLLRRGLGAAGGQVVERGLTRRWLRGACLREVSAGRVVKELSGGGRGGGCAASFSVRLQHRVRPRGWGRVCASVVAGRPSRCGFFEARCEVVERGLTQRSLRVAFCRALAAPRAAEALGEGLRVRSGVAPVASRSRRGGWSSR